MLHPYITASTKRPVASLVYAISLLYPASVVLFQLHGGMVSHMQALAIPSLTVHNTKYLILSTESILVLAASSWGSDVMYNVCISI